MTPPRGTLEPGVHDHEQAPWWEFYCDLPGSSQLHPVQQLDDEPWVIVKQWMGEAARAFAERLLPDKNYTVECLLTTIDGLTGHYVINQPGHPLGVYITINRGAQIICPTT